MHMHALTADLTVNGIGWDVISGTIDEDLWRCPATTAEVLCALPDDWQTLPWDVRGILPAQITLSWWDLAGNLVEDQTWQLMARASEVDLAEGTIRWTLASSDLIWLRTFWNSLTVFPAYTVAEMMTVMIRAWSRWESGIPSLQARLGISIDDRTGGVQIAEGAPEQWDPPGTGQALLQAVTLGRSVRLTVSRGGAWVIAPRVTTAQPTDLTLRTGVPRIRHWNALFAGMTVGQFNALFAGMSVGQFNTWLAQQRATGDLTAALVRSDLDPWANTAIGLDRAGWNYSFADTDVRTRGMWTRTINSHGGEEGVYWTAPNLLALRQRFDQAGREDRVETLARFDIEPGSWVRIRARGHDSGPRQVQRTRITLPEAVMTLALRPLEPQE